MVRGESLGSASPEDRGRGKLEKDFRKMPCSIVGDGMDAVPQLWRQGQQEGLVWGSISRCEEAGPRPLGEAVRCHLRWAVPSFALHWHTQSPGQGGGFGIYWTLLACEGRESHQRHHGCILELALEMKVR